MSKRNNLAEFAANRKTAPAETSTGRQHYAGRGAGEIVHISLRVTREDWKRLHNLGLDMSASLHGLVVQGVNLLLKSRGLPSLEALPEKKGGA